MTRQDQYIKALSCLSRAAHELHQALGYERIHDVESETVRCCLDAKLNNVGFLVEDAKSLVAALKPGERLRT